MSFNQPPAMNNMNNMNNPMSQNMGNQMGMLGECRKLHF